MISHQYPNAPEVYFVIFLQPGSILFEGMTGEDDHHVVCEGNQGKENQSSNHLPLNKCKVFKYLQKMMIMTKINMCNYE